MSESGRELVERAHRQMLDQLRSEPQAEPVERSEPPHTDLPPAVPGSAFAQEWELYRCEVGRLLAEGCRGRFALIKAGRPIVVWDTLHDAVQAGQLLYGNEPCLIQQIMPYLWSLRAG